MKKNNILTYILLVLTAVFWGGSFVLTKEIFLSAPSITPSIIVTLRLVIASVVFVPFLLITKKWQRIERKDWKYFFILAFLEPFTYFLFTMTLATKWATIFFSKMIIWVLKKRTMF